MIIQLLMTYHKELFEPAFISTTASSELQEQRNKLLRSRESVKTPDDSKTSAQHHLSSFGAAQDQVQYHLALMSLLATCSEGENKYIESMCQSLLDVHDLIHVLNDETIPINRKSSYLK
jgi:hypothetical protein